MYYKQRWNENLPLFPSLPSVIASQVICYNKRIKVENKIVYKLRKKYKLRPTAFQM